MFDLKVGKYGHKSTYMMNVETGEIMSKRDAIDQFIDEYYYERKAAILYFEDLYVPTHYNRPSVYFVLSRDRYS